MAKKKKATKKITKIRKPARQSKQPRAAKNKNARAERKLDEGLRETFPASDSVAVTDPVRSIKE